MTTKQDDSTNNKEEIEKKDENKKSKVDPNAVVVGITGRVDSIVAAYLLKKQGLKIFGVAILNFDTIIGKKSVMDGLVEKHIEADLSIYGHCHLPNLNAIKQLCEHLNIPLYAANGRAVFREKVIGPLISSRLSGQSYSPCVGCHKIIIDTLIEKAEVLGAGKIATGHYAKILKNNLNGSFNLVSSADSEADQSYLLSGLNQQELCRLLLPLSEMRKTETEKIAQSLNMALIPSQKKKGMCLVKDPKITDLVSHMAAPSLRKLGSLVNFNSDVFIADHPGIHHYTIGMNNVHSLNGPLVDKEAQVIDIDVKTGSVYIGDLNKVQHQKILVSNFFNDTQLDVSSPFECYVRFDLGDPLMACEIFPKNNGVAVVLLKEAQKGRPKVGSTAVFYQRGTGSSKIIGQAIVRPYILFENLEVLYESIEFADPEEIGRKQKSKDDNEKLFF